jgi:uncharacterized beta-barrel protein YwiB (DUF1934 family)
MQKCRFTITTNADGIENSINGNGELKLSVSSAQLHYVEADSQTFVELLNGEGRFSRSGAYSLSLFLKEQQRTKGRIGISETEGDLEIYTHSLQYVIGKDSLLMSAKYDLIFGQEIQKMQIRIYAKIIKTEGEE